MSWLTRLKERLGDVDADAALAAAMGGLVELAAARYPVDPGRRWRKGEPLEVLFAGYAGTRNTGADIRVEEMIRQLRWILGDGGGAFSILTIDPALSAGYFPGVRQLHLPQIFPKFVFDVVHEQHAVIACEGSMFKSKFANALSILMAGALGCAVAENKPAIGWGGEAGAMDPSLQRLVRRTCSGATILCRNEASRQVLAELGLNQTRPGTDTAWTVSPPDPAIGEALLRQAGWDGRQPVLIVAPIRPFGWPVKAEIGRAVAHRLTGLDAEDHYASIYFHRGGDEPARQQTTYEAGLVQGVRAFCSRQPHFVVVMGMERLDRRACESVAHALGGAPVFVSDDHRWPEMLSVLRSASMLLSSRYHAVVCSMGGLVPSAGVTMDERLRNLYDDRGTPELCLGVSDDALGDRVLDVLTRLHLQREAIRAGTAKSVAGHLRRMGEMGRDVAATLREQLPGIPMRPGLGDDPWAYLPPLHPSLTALVEGR